MEFPEIGKQCCTPHCTKLDFLPLRCKCGETFCPDHFNIHCQTCLPDRKVEPKKIDHVFICNELGCKNTSIVPLICQRCHKHFCITHRHLTECRPPTAEELAKEKEKYEAPVRKFNEAKSAVDAQLQEKLENAKKKPKSSEMANKVQLMRIKGKATGLKSIPTMDRLYFNIKHPLPSDKITPVFISRAWTLGKSIDAISSECKVQNNNNVGSAPKLRLFKTTGDIVSENVGIAMHELINEKQIIDGESLQLQYV